MQAAPELEEEAVVDMETVIEGEKAAACTSAESANVTNRQRNSVGAQGANTLSNGFRASHQQCMTT